MSSSPTVPTSTTSSSTSCPSLSEPGETPPIAVIACGALGASIRQIAARRHWNLELHLLAPLLHNHPQKIAPAVERLARELQTLGRGVVLAYADCGTYGALDGVCDRLHLGRLRGLHCYDVLAGPDQMRELFSFEPGTYVLTDFLVRSFRRTVLSELGLDRHPELWSDYFGHYRRVVWLAQQKTPSLEAEARSVADMFGVELTVREVGVSGLELELEELLSSAGGPGGTVRDADSRRSQASHREVRASSPAGLEGGARCAAV